MTLRIVLVADGDTDYAVRIESARERYDAFRSALEGTEVHAIRARSYPRIQGKLRELSGRG